MCTYIFQFAFNWLSGYSIYVKPFQPPNYVLSNASLAAGGVNKNSCILVICDVGVLDCPVLYWKFGFNKNQRYWNISFLLW